VEVFVSLLRSSETPAELQARAVEGLAYFSVEPAANERR